MTFALTTTTATATTTTKNDTRKPRRWVTRRRTAAIAPTSAAPITLAPQLTWGNRRPGSPGFARWADSVAHRIDAGGLTSVDHEVDALVELARTLGVTPTAVDVLGDTSAPEIARSRAFAIVVGAIANPS